MKWELTTDHGWPFNWLGNILVLLIIAIVGIGIAAMEAMNKREKNDTEAKQSIQQLIDAQNLYSNRHGLYGSLEELAAAKLLDLQLATGQSSGYRFFILKSDDSKQMIISAIPSALGNFITRTGNFRYGTSEDGILHFDTKLSEENFTRSELAIAKVVNDTSQQP